MGKLRAHKAQSSSGFIPKRTFRLCLPPSAVCWRSRQLGGWLQGAGRGGIDALLTLGRAQSAPNCGWLPQRFALLVIVADILQPGLVNNVTDTLLLPLPRLLFYHRGLFLNR